MKALIFNSGIGKRMGDFTKTHHKCMAKLLNGETILERQLRILRENGIKEVVITTGPFKEQIESVCKKFPDMTIKLVNNDLFTQTNYIYSMYLAGQYFDDDFLLMHGDLVFDTNLVKEMLEDERPSICLINKHKNLPEKDFKGRINDGKLREVSINIFDDDCFAFQPLYKLKKDDLLKWYENVKRFVINHNVQVYAENALNEILDSMEIYAKSYEDHYIDEIDNLEDYERVIHEIVEYEEMGNKDEKAKSL